MPSNDPIAAAVAPITVGGWYAINKKDDSEAEISIYDAIGAWGVTAQQFVKDLKAIKAARIILRLNTPGGEVFDGTAIYNALREHPARVTVHVDGVAASAGSFIACAGDEVRMADNAYIMIHNASGGVYGEAGDMRRYADVLEKINGNIAAIYQRKAGKDADHWRGLMDAETWFTAEEAKAEGLVDVVYEAAKKAGGNAVASSFDFKIYNKIPDPVKGMWGITQQNKAPETSPTLVETPPAVHTETTAMPENNSTAVTQADPAQTPAAGTIVSQGNTKPPVDVTAMHRQQTAEAIYAQGVTKGKGDGRAEAIGTLKQIVAVCPGNPQMALDAFVAGQTPEATKMAFDAAARVKAQADEERAKLQAENARLENLLATGGHTGVLLNLAGWNEANTAPAEETLDDPAKMKAHAEQEWDYKPGVRGGFTSKERYVAFRVRELSGTISRQVGA